MKTHLFIFFLLLSTTLFAQKNNSTTPCNNLRNISFNADWLFQKRNTNEADELNYDDSAWRRLDLPHDWSVEDLPNQKPDTIVGPFDRSSIGRFYTGYAVGGTGIYRKKFTLAESDKEKMVNIHFDGIYMNSDVWVNGHHLGNRPYGYTPFYYNLTPYLNPAGQENVIVVKVANEGVNSRWYSGSGIYRPVHLTVTNKISVAPWGVYITTPEITSSKAIVKIETTICNEYATAGKIQLVTSIVAPNGAVVGEEQKALSIASRATHVEPQHISVKAPKLWSLESPQLYQLITEIKIGNKTIDRVETMFGIRSIQFSADKGFLLNGEKVLLKGGCIHHDNGPLGAVAIDRAEERKVELLQKNGFNSIRISHNPPSKQLLDYCDRVGMLVIDEAFDVWKKHKTAQDYHLYFDKWWQKDLNAMILRDRNHPSVIMWSIGNEITETYDSIGIVVREKLIAETKRIDPTRPTTEAFTDVWLKNQKRDWDTASAPAFKRVDVGGYNYLYEKYEGDHEKHPNRIMYGSETHARTSLENWTLAEKLPYVLGDFVWTAMDYLGEASTGNSVYGNKVRVSRIIAWPWFNAWCGDIDLIGNKKPQSYYRDIVWRRAPIAMAVHAPIPEGMVENISKWGWPDEYLSWTWPGQEGKNMQVRVFSRAPKVRLLLNNKVVGEQTIEKGSITATFAISYQPGVLKAVNIDNEKEADAFELETTGAAKAIRLTADRPVINASRNDLSYIMVEVVDEKGLVIPNGDLIVHFSTNNSMAEIAGVGNGNPKEPYSFQQPKCKTFGGKCLVIIRPKGNPGDVTLKATSDKLETGQITIKLE